HDFVTTHEVLIIELVAFFNQGEDDVDLTALGDLRLKKFHYATSLILITMNGGYGLSPRRQFIDDAVIEIAVSRHCKRAGNRRGRHHQHVRGNGGFLPEFCALRYAEAVLLVDDYDTEVMKLHRILDHSMCADDDVKRTFFEFLQRLLSFGAAARPGEESHIHWKSFQQRGHCLKMLSRQNFCRRHQAGLEAIVDRQQHAEHGNHGLSAAHIALQEAVHLRAPSRIDPDLFYHSLLRTREFEWKMIFIK